MEQDNDKSILAYAVRELREKYQSDAPELFLPFKLDLLDKNVKVVVPKIGDKKRLIDLSLKNANFYIKQKRKDLATRAKVSHSERILKTLQKDLQLEDVPLHIECFDNSNLQGSNPVSSCVVFRNGKR